MSRGDLARCTLEIMASTLRLHRFFFAGPLLGVCVAELLGCASPAAPKPPSLHLPAPPRDLAALRRGENVEVSFTAPSRTTDGLLVKEAVLHGQVCVRSMASAVCTAVPLGPTQRDVVSKQDRGKGALVSWELRLPASLREGVATAAAVEVELLNASGKGAGWSAPAWFVAGTAPQPVAALEATGTRQGTLLRWQAVHDGGEVLLARTQLGSGPTGRSQGEPGDEVMLQADPGESSASETLDPSMLAGVSMRYTAFRHLAMQIGGHKLEIQSAPSAPVTFTWRDVYPPPAPTDLKAVGFAARAGSDAPSAQFSVDLIWEPVDDGRVTGYLVSRSLQRGQGDASTLR